MNNVNILDGADYKKKIENLQRIDWTDWIENIITP